MRPLNLSRRMRAVDTRKKSDEQWKLGSIAQRRQLIVFSNRCCCAAARGSGGEGQHSPEAKTHQV